MFLDYRDFLLVGLEKGNFLYPLEIVLFIRIIPGLISYPEGLLKANAVLRRKFWLNQEAIDCVDNYIEGNIWRPILHKDGHHYFSVFLANVDVVDGVDELDRRRLLRVLNGQLYLDAILGVSVMILEVLALRSKYFGIVEKLYETIVDLV